MNILQIRDNCTFNLLRISCMEKFLFQKNCRFQFNKDVILWYTVSYVLPILLVAYYYCELNILFEPGRE
jgi:hypothetical protein